ncbi:MAG: hypothetical protein P8X74_19600 [Reinekea sp.]
MLPKNWGEPMGAPAIFEKQIEIKLLHPASTEGVTDSGYNFCILLPSFLNTIRISSFRQARFLFKCCRNQQRREQNTQ